MSPEIHTLLIAIVTLSQILVMSFVAPIRLRRFSSLQYDSRPETEYPRWYPVPRAALDRLVNRHVVVLMATGLIGLIWLVCAVVIGAAPMSLAAFTMCFLLVQLWSGEIAWLPGARKVLRALREMPPPARRSVELHRWRISDFASPITIVLGFASQLIAVAVGVYAYVQGRHDVLPGSAFIVIALLACSLWILGRLLYRMLRPVSPVRIDPGMADADLYRLRQRVVQGQFVQAATVGLLNAFALGILGGIIALEPLWFFLAFSLWAQARSLLSPGSLFRFVRSQDFSVYRAA